jgi:dolichol-phosphate mannosyltransferase
MHGCTTSTKSLSLVIPAYNEAESIGRAVAEAEAALASFCAEYEVLVVDDGSRDRTAEIVSRLSPQFPRTRLLRHSKNRGYGAALRTGFRAARFDRVAFTDADCQFDLTDLASLMRLCEGHSIAVGYRIHRQDPWHRRFYSGCYNRLVRLLLGTGVQDCDCALKVFRRDTLSALVPHSSDFFVNAEMLSRARQLGYSVTETAVQHRPRLEGQSKVSLLEAPRVLRTLIPFWWSEILFSPRVRLPPRPSRRWTLDLGLCTVLLIAVFLLFARIRSPLLEPEEARYAEIPRQMLVTSSWLVPVLHGKAYLQKPPLLYWVVMASYKVFGIHDWAARLVPCGAALLCIVIAYRWALNALNLRAALFGGLILCLSGRFIYMSRMLSMDSLLSLCVVAAWTWAHRALSGNRMIWRWWLSAALATALGVLTKGPVALLLSVIPVLAWQRLDKRACRVRVTGWLVFALVAGIVAMPWYAVLAIREPVQVADFFWAHNVLRFLSPLDHEEPFWFYLPILAAGMLPWSLLLPALVRWLARRSPAARGHRPPALGFLLLCCLWCLIFYSVAGCKRPGYILPAMPALAFALGACLDAALPPVTLRKVLTALSMQHSLPHRATLLVLGLAVGGSLLAASNGLVRPASGSAMTAIGGVALFYFWRRGAERRVFLSWSLCAVASFLVLLAGMHVLLPGYARKFSLRSQVRSQRDLSVDPHVPVICYPHGWDSISFYLNRNDVQVYTADRRAQLIDDLRSHANVLLFVKSDHSLHELLRDLPASMEFVQRAQNEIVTAGLVCRRMVAPESLFASQ